MNIIPSVGDDFMLIYREYTYDILWYNKNIIQYNMMWFDMISFKIIHCESIIYIFNPMNYTIRYDAILY